MHPSRFKISVLALAVGCVNSALAVADDAAVKTAKHASIETITVTGEKTERSLKDTTSSVSVIDEETLKNGQFLSLNSAISEIPNLVVQSGAVPDIRGVSGNGAATGFNSFSGGAKPRVSTFVDGVAEPFVADLTGDTGLWDVQQIEVFRGPQSTSNGRNSIGGAVYMRTMDPTYDWDSKVRLGYRNQEQYVDSAVALSGPIVEDQLAFRVSGQYLDGKTLNKGIEYDGHAPDFDLNGIETYRVRSKLLWEPEALPGFKAMLGYVTSREQGDTGREYFEGDNPWDYVPITQRNMDTKADTVSLNLGYQLNPDMSLDMLVYHMNYDWGFDSYEANEAAEQQVQMKEKSASIDTKLNFGLTSEVLKGFVGLAYTKRDQDFNSRGATVYDGVDESDSAAAYGELSYTFATDWTVIAGGRLERETQKRDFVIAFRGSPLGDQLDEAKTIALPKLVLQYRITPETTLAISGRRGYNAGGGAFSFTTGEYYFYDQETVNTYEMSARSSLYNGNVNLGANLFYNDYDGYQALSSARTITNMPDVETYGIEFEGSAMLTDDLQLHAGMGLLKTKIKDAGEQYPEANGNELNSAPPLTASLGLKYWYGQNLQFGLSGNYVDSYFGDFQNTEERVAGDYFVARINANYETDNWLVSVYVNNLTDEKAILTREPAGGRYPVGYASILDPRSVGASVTYRF